MSDHKHNKHDAFDDFLLCPVSKRQKEEIRKQSVSESEGAETDGDESSGSEQ